MPTSRPDTVFDVLVTERREVAEGVVALVLEDPAGAELPGWAPGAHVDLLLTDELVRQYSLCGSPADRGRWRVGVLLAPDGRGGSVRVHERLRVGEEVRVRGPRNLFPLRPAPRYQFVAGGIGITPILPMLAAASAAGADWTLTYGGRTRASMAFLDELARYGDRVAVRPQDEFGLLDRGGLFGEPEADTLVYCCGPGPLLDAVVGECAHWPAGSLHIERFTPPDRGGSVRTDSFEVELAVTGTTLVVAPGRSVLDAVEEAGVPVLSSCREGVCGTCETAVLAGEVDHRDSLLTDEERAAHDTMLICVSRAAGPRIVLDL
ncbi:PDR/VanB family oxidoreductase [Streptomyces sp. NPDC046909]|uniref:PDR/VanB family oxidoreductase n=1 Tax=Streptomyces sp. NPDC046909 TaxID=3155617 RepID=UPI0033F1B870